MKTLLLNNAYDYCEAVCREASTTFYSSFSALQLEKRKAVHAVYALCRWVDDIVDGDEEPNVTHSPQLEVATDARQAIVEEIHAGKTPVLPADEHRQRLMALTEIRMKLNQVYDESITANDHPIFIALQDVVSRYPIKLNDFETVIEGMEDDLYPVQNQTWDELRSYCYKVASAVGLILIEIYGYEDRAARLHAIDLGIQMQLINVLRDINEDMERGRIYLPEEVLASHNITLAMLNQETWHKHWHGVASWLNTSRSSSVTRPQPRTCSGTSTPVRGSNRKSWPMRIPPSSTRLSAGRAMFSASPSAFRVGAS